MCSSDLQAAGVGHHFHAQLRLAVGGTSAHGGAHARRDVGIEDVGWMAAFLVSERAAAVTGDTHYVDAGVDIMG